MPYEGDSTDVVICDGLEDTLIVWRYGAQRCWVIGLPGIGALRHQKFPEGTKITVVADGDPPGSKGAELLQKGLDALILQGCEVFVTATPPEGWDANRFLVEYGVEALRVFLASAQPAKLSDTGEIRRLAKLDLLTYGRERITAAEQLGIIVSILDRLVDRERQKLAEEAKAKEDEWVSVDDTRPWEEEVDGVELLDELYETLGEFVIMSPEARCATALWIVFTYVFDAAYAAPKLWIYSPTKRCGKTRLVKVLRHLVKNPLSASRMSPAAFYRLVEARRPTLLLDDFDSWASTSEDFRNVLNAGFDKGDEANVWICTGDDNTPTPFSVWCPQVISGIGHVKDTVADRCIKIELQRKLRSQKVASTRRRHLGKLQELSQKCARWAADNLQDLHDAEPDVPDAIDDRAADGWELLIAIADHCGGHWKDRARQVAIKLSGGDYQADSDEDIGTQLLRDIRVVLKERGYVDHAGAVRKDIKEKRVRSLHLVSWLVDLEDRPWREFIKDRPLTPNKMASILRDFHITPRGSRTSRGYRLDAFERAFERYLPALPPDLKSEDGKPNGFDESAHIRADQDFSIQTVTPSPSEDFCGSQADFKPSPSNSGDGLKNAQNPQKSSLGDGVTVRNGKNGSLREEVPSNGLDDGHESPLTPGPEPTSIADEARRLKQENPSWSAKRVAAELGQPEARIARYLAS
jgi:putative DNA primase/helicase